jgi:hypothetical protein
MIQPPHHAHGCLDKATIGAATSCSLSLWKPGLDLVAVRPAQIAASALQIVAPAGDLNRSRSRSLPSKLGA